MSGSLKEKVLNVLCEDCEMNNTPKCSECHKQNYASAIILLIKECVPSQSKIDMMIYEWVNNPKIDIGKLLDQKELAKSIHDLISERLGEVK